MKKFVYTPAEREDAALILQICASSVLSIVQVALFLNLPVPPFETMSRAEDLARRSYYSEDTPIGDMREYAYAYAEALVRTGWCP